MTTLPWIRLDSQFATNPKVLVLIEDRAHKAVAAYVFGLGYCGVHGTDGFIPTQALPFIHATKREAKRLVEVGLWVPNPSGWDVNGWAEYQPSTDEQKARKERAKAGGLARAARLSPEQRSESASKAAAVRHSTLRAVPE